MRRGSRLAFGAVLGWALLQVLVLAPLAVAQAKPVLQVNVAASPADATIRKSHGSAAYTFTVSFTCLSGSDYVACSGQLAEQDVQVVPTLSPSSSPVGWEVKGAPGTFQMKAKETRQIPITVSLLDDEPERAGFSIGLQVRAQPITNPTLDPLIGGTLSQASSDGQEVRIEKILNWGEDLSSKARRFMWPLLFAAAVLLVTGVVLVERKRGSLEVACDAASQSIAAGRGASFPVTLRNTSKNDDRVHLSMSELPSGWAAIVPLNEIELRAGERTQMWVTVRAPMEATPGEAVGFRLRARSLRGQRAAEVDLSVTVIGDARRSALESVPPPPPAPPLDLDIEAEAPASSLPSRPRSRRT